MKKIINFFKNNSFDSLNTEIKGYGYSYSFKKFILQMIIMLSGVVIAGYYYLLQPFYIVIVVITAILTFPIIVRSQFRHMYNNKKFTNMVNYIEKMLIFFKQSPKIVRSLESVKKYCDKTTQTQIQEALDIIQDGDIMQGNIYEEALSHIETEYPSSRILALHRFIITVEKKSSKKYRTSLNNLDYDLKEWVNRVYQYQISLKDKKAIVIVSFIASIVCVGLFSIMYSSMNDFTKMVSNPIYQIVATMFLVIMLLLFCSLQSKVSGAWLINDLGSRNDTKILKKIAYVRNFSYKKEMFKILPIVLLFCAMAGYSFLTGSTNIAILLALFIAILLYKPINNLHTLQKRITRDIAKEFPLWLRNVALNLNSYVVVRAIENSVDYAPPILKAFLEELLREIEEKPNSMEPYENFLGVYKTNETIESMRSLYSLQYVSNEDSEEEISTLIVRNQKMLENGEKLRNTYNLIGIGLLQFIPTVLVLIKLVLDMVIMMIGMFANMRI